MSGEGPKRLGDYEILQVLGAGGMGRVSKVRNVITDRIEAMKVLLPDLQGQEQVAARFLREIKVLAALKHPNIATLHTALTLDDQLVMIMEFVEGQSLATRLNAGPIPVAEALTYTDQILDALGYAHQQHVIHRDIKPANMMLTPEGTVKLMDFGIARTEGEPTLLTAPGSTLGSMNYMSPEQVRGERTDERSDLYSLGISLYEMVTGQRPFHGASSYALMVAHVNQAPTPPLQLQPGIPEELNQIILTAIAKNPEQRFQSADAFGNAVRLVLRSLQESRTVFQGSQDLTMPAAPASPSRAITAPLTVHTTPPTPLPAPAPAGRATAPTAAPTAPLSAGPSVRTAPATAPAFRPAATPQATSGPAVTAPAPGTMPPARTRGLYMALGALVVMAALVAAGLYLPGRKRASAAGDIPRAVQQPPITAPQAQPVQPAPTPAQPVEAKPAGIPPASEENRAAEARRLAASKAAADRASERAEAAARAQQEAAARAAEAQAAAVKELESAERDVDQLFARSAAVNSSLEQLQRQQAATGYGLRGDISSRLASMKVNLSRAQDAIARKDAAGARRYADLATSDVEALEKFLGR
jgi:serine/threonine-protein kinase